MHYTQKGSFQGSDFPVLCTTLIQRKEQVLMLSLSRIKCHFLLKVNHIWGSVTPNLRKKKFVKKQKKSIESFANVVIIFLHNFLNNFWNFSSSEDHYWKRGIQKTHNFRVLLGISQRAFNISSWNLYGSKILPSSCVKHQKFETITNTMQNKFS